MKAVTVISKTTLDYAKTASESLKILSIIGAFILAIFGWYKAQLQTQMTVDTTRTAVQELRTAWTNLDQSGSQFSHRLQDDVRFNEADANRSKERISNLENSLLEIQRTARATDLKVGGIQVSIQNIEHNIDH